MLSHGANSPRTDRSCLRLAYLAVPEAIRVMGEAMPGGWPALMARNRTLARQARAILLEALQAPAPCPRRLLRVSCHIYNRPEEYERLARALRALLGR